MSGFPPSSLGGIIGMPTYGLHAQQNAANYYDLHRTEAFNRLEAEHRAQLLAAEKRARRAELTARLLALSGTIAILSLFALMAGV